MNLGGDGFINKPVEPIALAAQVRTMVRIKVAEDALRAEKQALERAVAERTAALQAETTKLDAIFDSSPVAMLVLDEKMSVVWRDCRTATPNRRPHSKHWPDHGVGFYPCYPCHPW